MDYFNLAMVNIAGAAFVFFMFLMLRHQLHMLQQNSYMTERYLRWFWTNKRTELRPITSLPMLSCFLMPMGSIVFATAFTLSCFAVYFFTRSKKPDKKKFVVTARVKRLYGAAVLLLAALLCTINLIYIYSTIDILYIVFVAAGALFSFQFLFITLVNLLLLPYEKLMAGWYVNDAKKKIESIPDLTVIGVTGSYGKTSSKYILHRILSEKFNVLMTPESYNTTLGVVRTIREQLSPAHQIFIAEMGARKRGDVKEICDVVKPKYGILTSIGPCHLETFGTMETVARTKFELAEAVPTDGFVMLNFDNDIIKERKKNGKFFSYGTSKGLDFWAEDISYIGGGLSFSFCTTEGLRLRLKTKLLGVHNVLNITAAAGLALKLGVSPEEIAVAVSQLKAVSHRLELKIGGGYTVIDDAYNSNPAGAAEALNVLSKFDGKRILVTPGMVEMGESGYEFNRKFGMHAAACCDTVIVVGKLNAEAIANGLLEAGFPTGKIHMVKNLDGGLKVLSKLTDATSVVLFENDLPDSLEL